MMEIAQKNPPEKRLPKTVGLHSAEQVKYEKDCIVAWIRYARQNLGI